jgi:hypothetical protein
MSIQDQTRELMTAQRHHDEHQKELMLNRAEAEVEHTPEADTLTQEKARELMAQQHQHDEHLKESMLSRAEAEVGIPTNTADSSH